MGLFDTSGAGLGLVAELFPFRMILGPGPATTVVDAGPTLSRWLGRELTGEAFDDCFAVRRPALTALDPASVAARRRSVYVLDALGTPYQLRGQMIPDGDHLLFVGSPVLTTASNVEELGLSMTDFAPHDATVDMVVLQRFAEMQLADLQARAIELEEAVSARDQFSYRATTDSLTGLANRRAFWDSCRSAVESGAPLGLLFIDVDRFKSVNDRFGHGAGDAVLSQIADRLTQSVRISDLVARLGGDEFAVLLSDADTETVAGIVDRLVANVRAPIVFDERELSASVSIGVVTDTRGKSVDELVQDADAAMYEGRQRGRGNVTWFADRMRIEREERRVLIADLELAVAQAEIQAAFQPIVSLADRSVVSCEVLARWQHPTRGPMAPDTFIELAELAGLIDDLDDLMLARALHQLRDWQTHMPTMSVQVNASGRSIGPAHAARVATALAEVGVPPASLTIEVTESWLISNESEVAASLNTIADLGVRIHLDDFGTGYSSLTHINALPISGLKIDRSFVSQAIGSERSRRLIAATISMGHSLDLEVTAEGVETEEEAALLLELGCDLGQGYLFGRPGPGHDLTALLASAPEAGEEPPGQA
ncbi:MAG: EAL domain-containing protein [Actinomycetota bacterium]